MRLVKPSPHSQAVTAAFLTPLLLGVAPIFGKLAILQGLDPFTVAAVRTLIAALLLWLLYAVFFPRYLYIYPAGLLGCIVVGAVNGIGSLFFYGGLGLLDASHAQLVNGMYVIFAVLLAHIGGERVDVRTWLRIALALVGIVMITGLSDRSVNWLGVGLMLANALMFAGSMMLSQFVLYEMPSPTATLYILTSMSIVVVMVWAAVGGAPSFALLESAAVPILLLGITTALSRIAMFAVVQVYGSVRTAVVAVAEIGVSLVFAYFVLHERMTIPQWVGVALLISSLLLMRARDLRMRNINLTMLIVRDVASIQFQRIAFHRAFGKPEHDNEFGSMSAVTTSEMHAIRQMMGAKNRPVDPFPLMRNTSPSGGQVASRFDDRQPDKGSPLPPE